MIVDKLLLFPYYAVLLIRNFLYDKKLLKSYHLPLPSVCVGNVTVGGTGKTPMVELLIQIYGGQYRLAVVSRGYGRKTKGYREVAVTDSFRDVGDEPLQIKKKFPQVRVVVDSRRKRAVEKLVSLPECDRPQLVLLDDAFQHRSVSADLNLLLVSSSRPVFKDALLPIGRLRDLPSRVRQADMVVITKVEDDVDSSTRRRWRQNLGLRNSVPLHFSRIAYLPPEPVFPAECDSRYRYARNAVLFSGIADDSTLRREVGWRLSLAEVMAFADHRSFTPSDCTRIEASARRHPTAMVLTTEKDAQRLANLQCVSTALKARLFYLPIACEIIPDVDQRNYISEELAGVGEEQLKDSITGLLQEKGVLK